MFVVLKSRLAFDLSALLSFALTWKSLLPYRKICYMPEALDRYASQGKENCTVKS
jgi:hypothetical protein